MTPLRVVVLPSARAHLDALPEDAQRRVGHALRVLAHAPRSGRKLPFAFETYTKVVILRRRPRWTRRIVYRIRGNDLIFDFLEAGWKDRELL